ncbi:cell adhesion molecule CEACAM19 [Carettochelys insculpta]|uniref:cell adhesion molecule CEACAM19 n=1 Tax=Carettochelys insculpta TaxID=44489 RepID=UPI003EBAC4A7
MVRCGEGAAVGGAVEEAGASDPERQGVGVWLGAGSAHGGRGVRVMPGSCQRLRREGRGATGSKRRTQGPRGSRSRSRSRPEGPISAAAASAAAQPVTDPPQLLPPESMGGPRFWDTLLKQVLFSGCLALCWCPCAVLCTFVVHVIPEAPAAGQNVTLLVELGQEPLRHFDWYRGRLAEGSTRIFSYFPGQGRPQRNGVQFTGREFGFPNGSLLLRGAQANDSGTYRVTLQLVPQGNKKGSVELRVSAPATSLGPWTLPTSSGMGPPPDTAAPRTPQVLGWVVAGVVVGILLTVALGAVVIYHFVLKRSDQARGSTGRLDPIGKKLQRSAQDDKEPIYEVMESPLELPQPEGRRPQTDLQEPPAIPLSSQLEPNYTELLQRAESVYAQMQR